MRTISKEKIEKYVESKQIKYFEINIKEEKNVDKIFMELVELILRDIPAKDIIKEIKVKNQLKIIILEKNVANNNKIYKYWL